MSSVPEYQRKPSGFWDWLAEGVVSLGGAATSRLVDLGGFGVFAGRMGRWLFSRVPRAETIWPNFYQVGVLSLPVVALTGMFIGMVLAVQTYGQFRLLHLETRMGAVINLSLCRELGPVLAATMLAGRVGSAMAAELGTMRVTEQIDALASMGANPIHYLVVPRFLACLILIPMLTIIADFMGVLGGAFYCTWVLGVDSAGYWEYTRNVVRAFDLFAGATKSMFFGAAIAAISCYRGFHCKPGAEGVGQAATSAFVNSFVVILIVDLILGIIINGIHFWLWPQAPSVL